MFKEAVVIALVDVIWLTIIGQTYKNIVQVIQGNRPFAIRVYYALPVYLALGYILSQIKDFDLKRVFLIGVSVYAVYDFTVLALFKDYTLNIAILDTLWGGILLAAAHYLLY